MLDGMCPIRKAYTGSCSGVRAHTFVSFVSRVDSKATQWGVDRCVVGQSRSFPVFSSKRKIMLPSVVSHYTDKIRRVRQLAYMLLHHYSDLVLGLTSLVYHPPCCLSFILATFYLPFSISLSISLCSFCKSSFSSLSQPSPHHHHRRHFWRTCFFVTSNIF